MSDDARFDPRFDPAFQPGYTGPLAASKPAPKILVGDPPAPLPVQQPVQPAVVDEADDDDLPLPRRANPFLIVLGVIALLLVGGGLYLVSRLRDLFADTQSGSDFDYVTLQVLMYASPLIIVLGLATAIGVLFVIAVRWGRR